MAADARRTATRFQLLAWTIPDLIEGMLSYTPRERFAYILADLTVHAYEQLPRDALALLLAYLVACGRDAQDDGLEHEAFLLINRLKARFTEPFHIYVHGMARDHSPLQGSWAKDMHRHADALLGMLELDSHERGYEGLLAVEGIFSDDCSEIYHSHAHFETLEQAAAYVERHTQTH